MSLVLTSRRPRLAARGHSRGLKAALACACVAFTGFTLALARNHPTGSFAGRSVSAGVIEGTAAIALVAAGLLSWRRNRGSGPLLVIAGFGWLMAEWTNPQAGFAPLFTLALVAVALTAALVVHLALAYPTGVIATRPRRILVVATYAAAIGVLGVAPNLFFDPRAQGCLECPRNVLLLHGDAAADLQLGRWAIHFAIVVFGLGAIAIVLRALRSSRALLAAAGLMFVGSIAYLAFVQIDLLHSVDRGVLSNDQTDVRLWKAEGLCLLVIAASVGLGLWRARATRTAMARLVVELAHAPRAGGARDTLAHALGDDQLRLWYRRPHSAVYVDGSGGPAEVRDDPGRATTRLVRGGEEIALMDHDEELLAEPRSIEEAITAAALAVDNERLEAELLAQAREMTGSRRRIVANADRQRRQLERDLHDGAQQRLVGLSLALRLLRLEAESSSSSAQIDHAEAALAAALADLREVAHGIYPAALRDEGLHAALEDLAEHVVGLVRVSSSLRAKRVAESVEEAAYFAATEILRDVRDQDVATVAVGIADGELVLEIERQGVIDGLQRRLIDITDRIGAFGGRVSTQGGGGELRLVARIPCE